MKMTNKIEAKHSITASVEANWFCQNLAIAVQRDNAFSILWAGRERF